MSQDNGYEISSLSEKNSIFRGDIMFGYTTTWSVDMIEELIDIGHFERKNICIIIFSFDSFCIV